MICPTCDGEEMLMMLDENGAAAPAPCPRCGGFGIAHCCDVDQPSDRDTEIEQTRDIP